MSTREFKGLSRENIAAGRRTRSGKTRIMTEETATEELSIQVQTLHAELRRRDEEVETFRNKAVVASSNFERTKESLQDRVASLQQELEQAELKAELNMLRTLDHLRAEHQRAMEREAERVDQWIQEIKKSHATERTQLLERLAALEKEKVAERERV